MKYRIVSIFICIALALYLLLRIIYVPIVHDEAATFFHYIIKGEFLPWIAHQDANNHILNSALEIVSFNIFGMETWALRLPNFISFFLFFFAIYKISKLFNDKYLSISFIVILICSQGFIEFFALARGYGLSMAFLMFSIWSIMEFKKQKKKYLFLLFMLSSFLALAANLTILPSILIMELYFLLILIEERKTLLTSWNLITYSIFNLLLIIIIAAFAWLGFNYQSHGALYYGSNDGLFSVTILSLAKLLFPNFQTFFLLIAAGLLLLSLWVTSIQILKKKILFLTSFQSLFIFLFFGNLLISIILNQFFKVHFAEDRTALYLYPIFIGFVFFSLNEAKQIVQKLSILVLLFVPIHFLFSMNIAYSSHWKNECLPESMYKIFKASTSENQIQTTLGGYQMNRLIWAYYSYKNNDNLSPINHEAYPNSLDDFMLAQSVDSALFSVRYKCLEYNKHSRISLLKRNKFCERELIFQTEIHNLLNCKDEFILLAADTSNTLANNSFLINFRFDLETKNHKPGMVLVVNCFDSLGNSLRYSFIELDWQKQETQETKYNLQISNVNLPKNTYSCIAYLWNPKKEIFNLTNTKSIFYKLY